MYVCIKHARNTTTKQRKHARNKTCTSKTGIIDLEDARSRSRSREAKSWIMDRALYAWGSPNFTGQSERNWEEMTFSRDKHLLEEAQDSFDQVWSLATPLSSAELVTLNYRRAY